MIKDNYYDLDNVLVWGAYNIELFSVGGFDWRGLG